MNVPGVRLCKEVIVEAPHLILIAMALLSGHNL